MLHIYTFVGDKVSHWVSMFWRYSPASSALYIDISGLFGEYGEYLLNSLFLIKILSMFDAFWKIFEEKTE